MRKAFTKVAVVALAACCGFGTNVIADDKSPLSGSAAVAFNSDYMFRGFQNYDGTSIQPTGTVNYDTGMGTLSGSVWAHISAESNQQQDKLTEVDYTATYTFALENTTLKLGHIWYTYPEDRDGVFVDTKEFYGTVAFNDAEWNPLISLNPSLTVYNDYDFLNGGQYYELSFSHLFEFGAGDKAWNLTPYVTFGFASNSEKIYANNGLVQTTLGASTTIPWGELTVTPSVNYTAESDDNTRNEFWFGTTIGWAS
jgi:hypothetical protein